jgi:1,4-dihydroxy-2-naphthoate octaprenyltransferase
MNTATLTPIRWRDALFTMPSMSGSQWRQLNPLLQWLIMVRAPVLLMTLCTVLVGLLLALANGPVNILYVAALLVGLTSAHATNNLLNDWIDSRRGIDQDNYFRARYGVQVLEAGLVSEAKYKGIVLLTALPALLAGAFLVWQCGSEVLALTCAGAFLVVFYTWPLKHWALGELAVLLAWGPLMTAGSYYVLTATLNWQILLVSLVYGVGPTLVILGKHIDKAAEDNQKGVHTLPVVIGERRARYLSIGLLISQWLLLASLVVFDTYFLPLVICLLALPPARASFSALLHKRPTERPADYPAAAWPLWFSAYTFRYTSHFGSWLILALIVCFAWSATT